MDKINNKTIIDFKTFRDYYFLTLRRNKLVLFISFLGGIALIMILIALGYNILNHFINGELLTFKTYTPTIIIVSILIVYYGLIFLTIIMNYNRNKASFTQPILYVFESDKMSVTVAKNKTSFSYEDILGVFQNKKYFVITFKSQHTTIVKKDAFAENECQLVEKKLKEIMDKLTDKALKNDE